MIYDWKMELYWRLPARLQEMAISMMARRLERAYFGPTFSATCVETANRSFRNRAELFDWQSAELQRVLQDAVQNVPYYRGCLKNLDRVLTPADLPRLPLLRRETVRERTAEFLSERFARSELLEEKTSGTSGSPLSVWRDPDSLQRRWAVDEVRVAREIGVSRTLPRAMIGGRPIVRGNTEQPPFWRYNHRWRQLYLSSYHISPRWAKAYAEAIRGAGSVWLTGYGSAIASLAASALDQGLQPVPMKAVLVSGDTLQPGMRQSIERFFDCRCYNHYGQSEGACWILECPSGKMHVVPDFGLLEIVNDRGEPCAPGESGQMVLTGFLNRAMPLIRYCIGDVASWATDQECSCGSCCPIVENLQGRVDDYLLTADGRRIGRLSTAMKRGAGIHSAQIVQDRPGHAFLLVRPDRGYLAAHSLAVKADLLERIGIFDLEIVEVQDIPKTPAGKVKLVVRLADQPAMRRSYEKLLPAASVR
jgi:phenylacetate-CoA ligase